MYWYVIKNRFWSLLSKRFFVANDRTKTEIMMNLSEQDFPMSACTRVHHYTLQSRMVVISFRISAFKLERKEASLIETTYFLIERFQSYWWYCNFLLIMQTIFVSFMACCQGLVGSSPVEALHIFQVTKNICLNSLCPARIIAFILTIWLFYNFCY